ncbi:MAG: 50S ribosomal protein L21 [Flavobacteriales bacterium]|jgi:large subunit ribosomal protein L21
MYAIVEIAGQQFKVEKDQQIFVHRLEEKEGAKVEFDNVLLIDNNGKVNVGAPAISGAKVTAKVLDHVKGDKVVVFKKKRRKGYRVKNGHRQAFTQIEIQSIVEKGATAKKATATTAKKEAKAEPKAAAKKAPAKKAPAKKAAPKAKTASAAKPKAATKKTTAKKPAAKKTAAKKTDK